MEDTVILAMPMSDYKDIISLLAQRERQREAKRKYYRSRNENVVSRDPYAKENNIRVVEILKPQTVYYPTINSGIVT